MDWKAFWNTILQWTASTGVKIVIALVVWFISFRIINLVSRRIVKRSEKGKADKTVVKTIVTISKVALKVLVIVSLVGYLGIDTSGFTALIASVGVCVGLAVNGALSNLAGGVLLLLTRPFKIDDYIEAQGQAGTVVDIRITNTKLLTPDQKVIYLPNGALANGDIVNYSENPTRRVDFLFSVGHEEDFEKAKQIITDICLAHELVLKENEPFIRVKELGNSGVNITARVWSKSADYWTVYFDITEQVKTAFDKEGIHIPYNQLDVHIKNKQ